MDRNRQPPAWHANRCGFRDLACSRNTISASLTLPLFLLHLNPRGSRQNPLMLAAMVAVFDEAFSVAAEGGETVASWKLPSVSGGAGEFKCSLDSLADLANLLVSAERRLVC